MRTSDRGFTLVEILVAMSLLLVALTMFGSVLFAVQRSGSRQDQLSRAADSAYQAIAEMDRQLRSGYIASQTSVSGTIDSVRIYTESFAPGSGSTVARCVAWAVVDLASGSQGLYTVWWTPGASGTTTPLSYNSATRSFSVSSVSGGASGFRLVADGLTGASDRTFEVPAITGDLGQKLVVTLQLREATDPDLTATGSPSSSPWVNTVSTTITPRNSPRSSMKADTSLYSATRSGLCG